MNNTPNGSRRVLIVLPDLAGGGAHIMCARLAHALSNQGLDVSIAVIFERPETRFSLAFQNLRTHRLGAKGFFSRISLFFRLAKIARRNDVVLGGMEFAATNYGYIGALIAQVPFVSWTHTSFHRHMYAAHWVDRYLSLLIYRRCKRVVFPSEGARGSLLAVLGSPPKNSHFTVINNFVETGDSNTALPGELRDILSKKLPLVIGVGRLVKLKAFDRLIRVHASLRRQGIDNQVVILGEGPMREALMTEAANRGVADTVALPGHVDDVSVWMAHASVFALCSEYEGLPLAMLEAMAAGAPVVAMDCPSGPREILRGGKDGFLIPAADEEAMVRAVASLLLSRQLRAKFAKRSRLRAVHYSAERIMPQWVGLLDATFEMHRERL